MDIQIQNEGSIYLIRGISENGQQWLDDHISDDAQMFGDVIVVEHRYIDDIVSGIIQDGLKLV